MKSLFRFIGFIFMIFCLCSCSIKLPKPGGVIVDVPGAPQQVIYPGGG